MTPAPSKPDKLRDLLISWTEINSGSGNAAGLKRMAAALAHSFSQIPRATTEELPLEGGAAPVLSIRARPEAPVQILLSGHYDTVYDENHPFQGCTLLNPQTLRGPGVLDMKGGLLVILEALLSFERSSPTGRLGWEVLLNPDEETGSLHSGALLSSRAKRHRLALVFEPARANGDLVRSRMGVGFFTATAHGRAAHAGRDPAAGRNAILALAEFLPQAHALNREMTGVKLTVGRIQGGGPVNIVPDLAQADIDLRVTRMADVDRVLARLRSLAEPINARDGYRLEISGRLHRAPKEPGPTEERLFLSYQSCASSLGAKISWQDVGGASDGNLFSGAGLPNLDGLGPVGDHLHSPQEFVHLPTLAERAAIAALFLGKIDAGEIEIPAPGAR